MNTIFRIVSICLGTPPKTFTWEYTDKSKKYHKAADISPLEFYNQHVRCVCVCKDKKCNIRLFIDLHLYLYAHFHIFNYVGIFFKLGTTLKMTPASFNDD